MLAALAVGGSSGAVERNARFRHIGVEEGLSQATVRSIFQDTRGFMWIATEDGLNRYDGRSLKVYKPDPTIDGTLPHVFASAIAQDRSGTLWIGTLGGGLSRWNPVDDTFTTFKNDPQVPTSLSEDRVRVIHEDSQGRLWVATDGGLNRYDRDSENFARYNHNPSNPQSLSHDSIHAIAEDEDGTLWIGTDGGGLDRYFPATGVFEHHRHDPDDPTSLSDDRVHAVYRDREGELWVGTEGGLNRLDRDRGRFERYRHDPADPDSISHDYVQAILEDSHGSMWIATVGGLNELDRGTGSFSAYRRDPGDPASLRDDDVLALFQDRGGLLWVGTRVGGISQWNLTTGTFVHFKHEASRPASLSHDVISSFASDRDGGLWVGTFGGGLNRLDRRTGRFEHFRHDRADPASLSDDRVSSLLVDSRGELWAGTFERGLNRLDESRKGFVRFGHDPSNASSLSWDQVSTLYEDGDSVLWVGTFGGGLNRLDPERETFVQYRRVPGVPTSLGHDRVSVLHEDSTGVLWVGTWGGGLNRFDRANGTFSHYRHDPQTNTSLSNDTVYSIFEDSRGTLWVGTRGTALNAWRREDRDTHRGIFRRYTERDGLPSAVVYGILEDETGLLWMSTNRGITKFDPLEGTFRSYDMAHGLQSLEFNFGAHHESPAGEMFFGGLNGFNAFYPSKIQDNPHVPPILLTGFYKLNERVSLPRPIFEVDALELGYEDDVISFEFAALDYSAPENNRYAYKLEGFDQDWIELGNLNRATYTNLDAGNYVFRVKGSNNDGLWNEEGASVRLSVPPPPWKSWWAYAMYAVSGALLFGAYTRLQHRKLEREAVYSRKLELEVHERTQELAQRNQELEVLNRKLEEASLTDALTGLGNRRFLIGQLERDVSLILRDHARPGSGPRADLLLLMVDLDHYKEINDRFGHNAGDRVLLQVREILKQACRSSDTIVRWGGDEFLVAGRTTERSSASILAERIRSSLESHAFDVGAAEPVHVSCSVGFASFPFVSKDPDLLSWEQVLAIADRALYVSKHSGRNAWVGFFSTDRTPQVGLLEAILRAPDRLMREGQLEVATSFGDPERLDWAAA